MTAKVLQVLDQTGQSGRLNRQFGYLAAEVDLQLFAHLIGWRLTQA